MRDRDKQKAKVFRIQLALPLLVRPGQGWQLEEKAGRPTGTYILSLLWQVTSQPLAALSGGETVDNIYGGLFTTISITDWITLCQNECISLHLNISADRSETHHIKQHSHIKVISLHSMSNYSCTTSLKSWHRITGSNQNVRSQSCFSSISNRIKMLHSCFSEVKLSSPGLGYNVDMRKKTFIIDSKSRPKGTGGVWPFCS